MRSFQWRIILQVLMTSKLDAHRRTTIPQKIREVLNLKPGDKLDWEISGRTVFVSVVRLDTEPDVSATKRK